jgi:hypothetical protein
MSILKNSIVILRKHIRTVIQMLNSLILILLIYIVGFIFDSWGIIGFERGEVISLPCLGFAELLLVTHVAFEVVFQLIINLCSLPFYGLWSYKGKVVVPVYFPKLNLCVFKILLYFFHRFICLIHIVEKNFFTYLFFLLIHIF